MKRAAGGVVGDEREVEGLDRGLDVCRGGRSPPPAPFERRPDSGAEIVEQGLAGAVALGRAKLQGLRPIRRRRFERFEPG
jgi:hypothetical protein